jgi:hypothetical protein
LSFFVLLAHRPLEMMRARTRLREWQTFHPSKIQAPTPASPPTPRLNKTLGPGWIPVQHQTQDPPAMLDRAMTRGPLSAPSTTSAKEHAQDDRAARRGSASPTFPAPTTSPRTAAVTEPPSLQARPAPAAPSCRWAPVPRETAPAATPAVLAAEGSPQNVSAVWFPKWTKPADAGPHAVFPLASVAARRRKNAQIPTTTRAGTT